MMAPGETRTRFESAGDFTAVLHVGYLRTGTTTHQRKLFAKHKDVAYIGKPYPNSGVQDLIYRIAGADSAFFDMEAAREEMEKVLATSIRPQGRVVVCSDEAMLSPYCLDTSILCDRLIGVFGKPKVLITIRRQDELLISWLFHVIKKPYALPLANSMRQLKSEGDISTSLLHYLDFAAICGVFVRRLGKENVLVLPYELLKHDLGKYSETFSGFVGIDAAETQRLLAASPVTNRRQSNGSVAYYDFKRRFLFGANTPSLDSALTPLFEMTGLNARRVNEVATSARQLCAECYGESNRRLADAFGLDLGAYSYPGF